MTLSNKQQQFSLMVARLILHADRQGYGLTLGEAWRPPEQALRNQRAGNGIANSLHTLRLAIDLNLFIAGEYQSRSEAWAPLGAYWESLGGSWGGRFKPRADGNHFSLEHQGIR
ncbi:M15 family metallopeptidase [Pantoea sp. 1.19]|uniref:M15 family metallopeptidase n=1 Tax=Pantoea sp. 1.19 TaxID=1925589 RepID=UPI0009490F3B|nr:M15 family metallopeptidase [Pantoea sp. 1.19]